MFNNDGRILAYSAEDGALLWERQGDPPDLSLHEEFFTDNYRIESPLHSAPQVYDIKTGRFVRELERDAYLTYVTQSGDYIITQYLNTDGYVFGLLLDGACEILAVLPFLSDVMEDMLIFNYPTGNVREVRIHSLDEITELAFLNMQYKPL